MEQRYGVLLTGGTGKRLSPMTNYVSKHLIPVNGKPIIDFPMNTLKQMGINNLTIIVGSAFSGQIMDYIKDGSQWEMNIKYIYQNSALGIAHAINLAKDCLRDASDFTVLLGDNFFENVIRWNNPEYKINPRAQIVLSDHRDLKRFGVASIDGHGKILKIEEKPLELDSKLTNLAISGCYLFTQEFFEYFKELKPSARNEYEITAIIQKYLDADNLTYSINNGLWSDLGTPESIASVNNYLFAKARV